MHVIVFAYFIERILHPLYILLQVQPKNHQDCSNDGCSDDITRKMADHTIFHIPLVLMRPQIDKILVCLEGKGHQPIPRGRFR